MGVPKATISASSSIDSSSDTSFSWEACAWRYRFPGEGKSIFFAGDPFDEVEFLVETEEGGVEIGVIFLFLIWSFAGVFITGSITLPSKIGSKAIPVKSGVAASSGNILTSGTITGEDCWLVEGTVAILRPK